MSARLTRRSLRALRFAALPLTAMLFAPSIANAQTSASTDAMLPRELEGLAQWLAAKHPACTERCFVLESMKLTGALATGVLSFEIHGSVIADGAVAVPLFGPVEHVRIESALEDGKPATIGFEGDRYFLNTASKRFVLKGTLAFTASNADRALTISGPLNALDAAIDGGRMLEGDKLSGLAATTLHFEATADGAKAPVRAEPPIFQIARAVRIGREIDFEYRVTARAGGDLGELRLPLGNGEKVVDVGGAREWKVVDAASSGKELLVATSGRSATLTITGTLPQDLSGKSLAGDSRAAWEHWLVESDAEHQVKVDGDGKQIDVARSPVGATQPSARLFLLKRGQKIALDVHALSTIEALAAVVPQASRTMVLTDKGDLVSEDLVSVQNNGVDYLSLTTGGRPIYVATDDVGERLMRKDASAAELLIPLKNGLHSIRVQSTSALHPRWFGGALTFPELDHALTTSRQTVTIGLPASVHPIALFGGARTQVMGFGESDAIAMAVAAATAMLLAKGRRDRALGAAAIAGTWFLSPALFVGGLAVGALVTTGAIVRRRMGGISSGKTAAFVAVAIAGAALVSVSMMTTDKSEHYVAMGPAQSSSPGQMPAAASATSSIALEKDKRDAVAEATKTRSVAAIGGVDAKADPEKNEPYGGGGVLANASVTPVALPMPSAERYLSLTRELVTRDRPLRPVLWYVTDVTVAILEGLWLACALGFAWRKRAEIVAARDRIQAWIAAPPAPPPITTDATPTASPAE